MFIKCKDAILKILTVMIFTIIILGICFKNDIVLAIGSILLLLVSVATVFEQTNLFSK